LRSKTCVLLFVDTLSTVSNFALHKSFDNSLKPKLRFDLLPPYYELQTFISYKSLIDPQVLGPFEDHAEDPQKELRFRFSIGRPMWYAYFFCRNEKIVEDRLLNTKSAVHFAMKKLSFSETSLYEANSDTKLAVFSCRFGVKGVLDHT